MAVKYKNEIIVSLLVILFIVAFYYLYGLILPFVFGLTLAFVSMPIVRFFQKLFKNQNLSITAFLLSLSIVFLLIISLFSLFIVKDFNRVNDSFKVLIADNKDELDNTQQKIKDYLSKVYDFNKIEEIIRDKADSLSQQIQGDGIEQLDIESIKSAFKQITSVFQRGDGDNKAEKSKKSGFGLLFIFFTTILYYVLCLYNIDYFISLRMRYFNKDIESNFQLVLNDFNNSFARYFKLRTKIVVLLSLLYILAFVILNMPGIILFTVFIVILSYVPYLQYLMLIPLSIGCLVLSLENDHSFFLYFGIVAGVFVIASLIEELVMNPFIMEKNIGMNPVTMVLALSIWAYIMGIPGVLIGVPLTSLMIIYFKRHVVPMIQKDEQVE